MKKLRSRLSYRSSRFRLRLLGASGLLAFLAPAACVEGPRDAGATGSELNGRGREALAYRIPLVTRNREHFRRVPGLMLADYGSAREDDPLQNT